ncbi:MAG: DASS family sodium-coupled anion symporter [Bryobacteraceae bacterium]|nr:DASS family sodium-coupled anion symporter [Bryobacteraceae bacterium]
MAEAAPKTVKRIAIEFSALAVFYCGFVFLLPRPESVTTDGWRLTALFLATVLGSILQPVPGGAVVLLAITLAPVLGGMKIADALGGYADSTVWLVMAAFFVSRALIDTGMARRIALLFIRLFGKSSLGVGYALALTDWVLASIIPSNAARSGGVILPICRSICELYGSYPGETAKRLGRFLMAGVYQSVCVSTAMFLTGQASNPLAAQIASGFGYKVTWAGWLVAGIVPGAVSLALTMWLVLKLNPPEIRHTPEAARFAHDELVKMGPMTRAQKVLLVVFISVCGAWVSSGQTGVDITVAALWGSAALLITEILKWETVVSERAAWDIFIWYGGLLRLGKALNEKGVTKAFAEGLGGYFSGLEWLPMLAVMLLIYFYAHYAFASITAHMLAMYPPFLALLAAQGAPLGVVVFSFACFVNLSACLTHFGTTPAPMFFSQGYVSMRDWWRTGFVMSIAHLAVWGTIGFAWWKLLGLW